MIIENPTNAVLDSYINELNTNADTVPADLRRQVTPISDKTLNTSREDTFSISFYDNEQKKKVYFNFALLPAIETTTTKGQGGVPEVKPGVVTMTNMKYKNFLIPGATPIVQAIGVQSTTHQFVGAFIGSETIGDLASRASMNPIYRLNGNGIPWTDSDNAIAKARLFDHKVVQSARPVELKLKSDAVYTYEGVIVNFKFYAVRADRAYYTLDLLATKYPTQLAPVAVTQFLSDGAMRGQSPATDKPSANQNRSGTNVGGAGVIPSDGALRGINENRGTTIVAPAPPGSTNRGPDFKPPTPPNARTTIEEKPKSTGSNTIYEKDPQTSVPKKF